MRSPESTRRWSILIVALAGALALAACGDDGNNNPPIDARVADAAAIDAADIDAADIDAATPDAADIDAADTDAASPDAADVDAASIDATDVDAGSIDALPPLAPHLLVTEIDTTDNDEFVEIYNPTDQTIDLRDYYLTDHQRYFQLPGVVAGNTTVTTDASDFLVRFPVGATIAPRQTITVAMDAVGFEASYAAAPTYAVQEAGNATPTEVVWIGTGTPNPGLTNGGEIVVLFYWDGASDNVKDVDIVLAGNAPSATNTFLAKTDVDGPDADTTATAYAIDTPNALFDMETDTPVGTTYKRIAFEDVNEVHTGGNGITGDDESSEAVRVTWDSQAVATGYTAGTPGVPAAALTP
ncbi:MAG: lamin tail domain-containing protein [Myxococcales bacterium]|nr:lamin tail domain-containing protein [Myxococcales bacterium]